MRRVVLVLVLAVVASAAAIPASSARTPASAAAPADELARADFDDDGFVDLAVGIPGEDVEAHDGAGAVVVLYGSDAGLTGTRAQQFHQDLPQIADRAEAGDAFGAALASGDFDNDGFADLAVGIPGEDQGQAVDAGAVHLLFGQAGGLTAAGSHGVFTETEPGDRFGAALAAGLLAVGQLDEDDFPDLVVGAPGDDAAPANRDTGDAVLIRGTASGLSGAGSLSLNVGGVGSLEQGDHFGAALAARDFDADGFGDLAAGMPLEDVDKFRDAGALAYVQGPLGGPDGPENRPLHQDSAGVPGAAEPGDHFGAALAPGPAAGP